MTPETEVKLSSLIQFHEGRVRCMYPDSAGNVTVGVGHLLGAPAAAVRLPFVLAQAQPGATREKAMPLQIAGGWMHVKSNRRPYREIELTDAGIDELLRADIANATEVVRGIFPLDTLPESVAVALIDMAFNLGSFHKFPKFCAAVHAEDWKTAADECVRQGIGVRRNEDTRRLLLAALSAPATQSA